MGGAIAVHVASRQKLSSLAGLVVIDVVEGLNKPLRYFKLIEVILEIWILDSSGYGEK